MKQLTFILLAAMVLVCAAPCHAVAQKARMYEYTYGMEGIEQGEEMVFADSLVHVVFEIEPKQVSFVMKNLSPNPIRVIWDETSFIDNGEAKRIMHAGVKHTERNNPQPATLIPHGAAIDDMLLPTDNISYYGGGRYSNPDWIIRPLFMRNDYGRPADREQILNMKGRQFAVFMPIQAGDKTYNYHWKFYIYDVKEAKR